MMLQLNDEYLWNYNVMCNALFIYLIILAEFRVFYMIYVNLC